MNPHLQRTFSISTVTFLVRQSVALNTDMVGDAADRPNASQNPILMQPPAPSKPKTDSNDKLVARFYWYCVSRKLLHSTRKNPILTIDQCACETDSQLIHQEICEQCSTARCADCRVRIPVLKKREGKVNVRRVSSEIRSNATSWARERCTTNAACHRQ